MKQKRPRGITLLAILLVGATIGGIVIAGLSWMFAGSVGLPWYTFAAIGSAYALSAGGSGIGLWRMARWAVGVFVVWGATAVLASILMIAASSAPVWEAVAISLLTALTVSVLGLYVRHQISTLSLGNTGGKDERGS